MDLKKLQNITIGWSKWVGLTATSKQEKEESIRRLQICEVCAEAKPSEFLEFVNGKGKKVDGMFCTACFCPCHQKSLTDDLCPLGKWAIN